MPRAPPLQVYGLRRLARGLGSSRQGARQGFATALTLVLQQQPQPGCVQADDVIVLLESCLEAGASLKGGVRGRGQGEGAGQWGYTGWGGVGCLRVQ